MAEKNFTVKVTLDEANQIRESLRLQRDALMASIDKLDHYDKLKIGIIDTLLRRDFG